MSRSRKKKASSFQSRARSSSKSPRGRGSGTDVPAISREAIQSSLRSPSLGDVELPEAELDQLHAALATRHANVLRHRRDRTSSQMDAYESVPWYPLAVWPKAETQSVSQRDRTPHLRPSKTIDYAAGDYYLQDAGSLLAIAAVTGDRVSLQGQLVLDLCAAPGGKASALLEAINQPLATTDRTAANATPGQGPGGRGPSGKGSSGKGQRGFLLANETIGSRIAPLAFNLARTGSDQYAITNLDPDTLAERLPGVFDVIVVDAPCSGQAMVGRGKQSATAVAENQIAINAARQQRILRAAERLLRPGGRLVYSTCTFAVAENEEQVQFMIDDCGLQASSVQELVNYASPLSEASYRLWPHRHRCAGSFAASLRKPDRDSLAEHNRRLDLWVRMKSQSMPPPDAAEQLPFLFASDSSWFQARDWIIDGFPSDSPAWTSEDYVRGPEMAHRTGTTWKPSHAAALRHPSSFSVERLDVDDDAARLYLSGQAIPASRRGWQVVQHLGRPLGWIKGDGRIGKNHLPTHARMQVA